MRSTRPSRSMRRGGLASPASSSFLSFLPFSSLRVLLVASSCVRVADLVALGREGVRHVLAQGHQEEAVLVGPQRVQVEAAERGVEVPRGGEEQVLALVVEAGRALVGELGGDAVRRAGLHLVEEDGGELVRLRPRVGHPVAGGAEGVVGDVAAGAAVDAGDLAAAGVHQQQVEGGGAHGEPLAVGRPLHAVDPRPEPAGQLLRLAGAVGRAQVDLVLVGRVGDVGHLLAVGRPHREALAHAGRRGEVAHGALLRRDAEDLAAGVDHGALAVGRDARAAHLVGRRSRGGGAPRPGRCARRPSAAATAPVARSSTHSQPPFS